MSSADRGARIVQPLSRLAERSRARGENGAESRDQPARIARQTKPYSGVRFDNQHDDRDVSAHNESVAAATTKLPSTATGESRQQHDEDHAQERLDQRSGTRASLHGSGLGEMHRHDQHNPQAARDHVEDVEYNRA